jgi:hypothetical protein
MRLLLLQADDQALDLIRQLVGIADRPAAAIGQGFEPALLVSIEDFVAGLSGYPERPANIAHRLAIEDQGDKLETLVHDRTLLPRHRHPPLNRGTCHLCVRYVLSPMCRAAQIVQPVPLVRPAGFLVVFEGCIRAALFSPVAE